VEPLAREDQRQLGEFWLVKRLGEGGMGRVFLGRSMVSGRPVAVKVIKAEYANDLAFMTRFRREVAAVSVVSGAFTAPPVAAGPDDIPPWVATEFMPGPTLRKLVHTAGPLPESAVWNLAGSLVEALREIHRHGLVHRDLKPENILLASDGPRVIDFGISRDLTRTVMTDADERLGTLLYMSPEQLTSSRVSQASDVFSLGSVIAFAATGREPFAADHTTAIIYRITEGDPDLSALPAGLRRLVAACLVKDPVLRPSLDQLTSAIKAGRASFPEPAFGKYWPDSVARLVESMMAPAGVAEPAAPGPAPPAREPAVGRPVPAVPVAGERTMSTPGATHDWAGPITLSVPGPGGQGPPQGPPVAGGKHHRSALRGWQVATLSLVGIAIAAVITALTLLNKPASTNSIGAGSSAQSSSAPPSGHSSTAPSGKPQNSPSPSVSASTSAVVPPTYVTVCTWPGSGSCTLPGNGFMSPHPPSMYASADGAEVLRNLTWSGWGTPRATAQGTMQVQLSTAPATVILTDLVPYQSDGSSYEVYSTIVIHSSLDSYDYTSGTVPS
jgi:serine/threonine protein kinase